MADISKFGRMSAASYLLLVVSLSWQLVPCLCGSVQLVDTRIVVQEGTQFDIRVRHTGDLTQIVNVIVSVDNLNQDFVGSSQVGSFAVAGPDVTTVTFTVADDNEPEIEETYIFTLSVLGSGTEVTAPNVASVIIQANDDAYGVFDFTDASPVRTKEDPVSTNIVNVNIGRKQGTFGQVTVTYKVVSSSPDGVVGEDIAPSTGTVVFASQETRNTLQLQIRADTIPENDEEFTVVLTSATQGARVGDSKFSLIILANDAPVRFKQNEFRFDEGPVTRTVSLTVTRGLDGDGVTQVGSLTSITTLNYVLLSNTALIGQDFRGQSGQSSGQLAFPQGESEASINIEIVDDGEPEVEESFQCVLSSPATAVGDFVLVAPTKADVIINANDNPAGIISLRSPNFISPPVHRINEDQDSDAIFTVIRTAGSFGIVSVKWVIQRNDSRTESVTLDVSPESGTVTFAAGERERPIIINIKADTVPEPAERFALRLLPASVTGSAKVEGIIYGLLIIEDSDNIYGTLQFAGDEKQKLVINADPRMLQLTLSRTGANNGDLHINLTVTYFPAGDGSADVLEDTKVSTVMSAGLSEKIEHIHLLSAAFIQVGGVFKAELTGINLVADPAIGAFNSPRLGTKTTVAITVTSAEANGEIGFKITTPLMVTEPAGDATVVSLILSREGTSGDATITWAMQGTGDNAAFVTAEDVGAMAGTVVMKSGASETTISVTVEPDDIPELDEELTITLSAVEPRSTQRLRAGATTRKLVIQQNDNPGGVFQFAATDPLSYQIEEGGSPAVFTVVREDGSLLQMFIQYSISGGEKDFYGATNVLTFPQGIKSKTFSVAAIPDGTPELEETFTLRIQGYGNSSAVIGSRSNVELKVTKNDDPHGVLEFKDKIIYLNESRAGVKEVATVTVHRDRGLFGSVQVKWKLDPSDEVDLRPAEGFVTFTSDQDKAFVTLESVPDEVSEAAETFTLTLLEPQGGATIGPGATTSIVIRDNDFQIYFLKFSIEVEEPSETTVTIKRDGPTDRVLTLKYRTVAGTAIAGDFTAVTGSEVTFGIGEVERTITVRVLDDTIAEGKETFYLSVYEILGDAVFRGPNQMNITVLDNDEAYGVFHFDAPFTQNVEEGSTVSYAISRDKGTFGGVNVYYELFSTTTNRKVFDGGDFAQAENLKAVFQVGDRTKYIKLTPRIDNEPENDKTYTIKLTRVEVFEGRTDVVLTRIGDYDTQAMVTILANDDPNGRFGFPLESQARNISEDYDLGMAASAQADFKVERRMGIFGTVELMWEVYSDKVTRGLPRAVDLIFLGNIPSALQLVPSKRRPGTGTNVVSFPGNTNTFISVAILYQPSQFDIADGFSVSAWVQPFANTDGYIMAKTNNDGSRHFYTLRMVTSSLQTTLVFGYSITGSNENNYQSVVYQRNLEDITWHHLVVTAEKGTVNFYVDTNLVGTRALATSQMIIDNRGQMVVGAIYPGKNQFSGYLQDVRVYSRQLTVTEISELYQVPARLDVNPVSGYITFQEGTREGRILVSSLQDTEEESNEIFTVQLVNAKGGATLSTTDNVATLTVLKSDNANGLFALTQCLPSRPRTEDAVITCSVARERGDDGKVVVTWSVYQLVGSEEPLATDDFIDFTGKVVFEAGDRVKTFTVQLKDDNVPELEEVYEVRLVGTETGDGQTGTTSTSGASIDEGRSKSRLTMVENDYPNGLVQFSVSSTPPRPTDPVIPPATEAATVRVKEESGLARLLVVRAQGYQGQITVEWRTTDGSAKSSNKVPPDFSADVGRLTMKDNERYAYIEVTIIDNNIPEDEKSFTVTLLNPSGGAALGVGSQVTVVIEHSDGAFGVFQFSAGSVGVQAEETGDSGFNYVILKIERTGGNIGHTNISWEVQGDKQNDIVEHQGVVTFSNGQLTSDLALKVRGDTVAELDELFVVQIVAVSRGQLGASQFLRSEVTVLANDAPYGKFVIPDTQRPKKVDEQNTAVSMTVMRLGGTYGEVEVNFTTLQPSETYPYLPTTVARADLQDYQMRAGSVRFTAGQGFATFNINILDDVVPEEDEAVYVRLTGVRLITGAQIRPVSNSPSLGLDTESYGQIIINYNDNANGELVLSPLSPKVQENQTAPFLFVSRFGGAFGEVSVTFTVKAGTAIAGLDFVVLSNQVRLARGVKSAPLSIRIVDDNLPELQESFTVELGQVSGGGTLGTVTTATVVIDSSDDPNGAFGFEVEGISVEEPETTAVPVNITVKRSGGSLGVVTLDWVAMLRDAIALDDITPSSGSVYFVSNEASRTITIQVKPDDLPEGQEDIQIQLRTVSNGGHIGERSVFTLSIKSNDNPHGVVQFTQAVYEMEERGDNSVQQLPLTRSGGNFGELRVYYSTGAVTTAMEDVKDMGEKVLDYFLSPKSGSSGVVGETITIGATDKPAVVCASACLTRITCKAFELQDSGSQPSCAIFSNVVVNLPIVSDNIKYYVKDTVKAGELTGVQATAGEDYTPVTNGYILIPEGATKGLVPITILADTVPELNEKFLVSLTRVDVTGNPPSLGNSPYLGEARNATVTIKSNDDTYGALIVYSDSPLATQGGHVIQVEEKQNLAVDLIVERLGGSIGEVSVQWSIDRDVSTAVYGKDYRADGATITFVPGETRKLISITILDDAVPELSKTVIVRLTNSRGGALIRNGTATVIILENDNVAGVVSLNTTSVLAKEGDSVYIQVLRDPSTHGTVNLEWYIQGLNGKDPALGFQSYKGSIQFLPGESKKTLVLDVLKDNLPEVNEEYQLQLTKITTSGVGVSGSAVFDPLSRMASISIAGSNNPHGVVQFSDNSLNARFDEDSGDVSVKLNRKFGAIGKIRVDYEITLGSVSVTNAELVYAEPSVDFLSKKSYVELDDGVSSASIVVTILDDDVPEVDEVFIVRLLSVTLVQQESGKADPPVLGPNGTVSQVIVNANDGTKGIAVFSQDSAVVSVDEVSRNISLMVVRDRGTFGEVSVFFYAQSIVEGTNLGLDFKITPQELVFLNGVRTKQIQIEIINDDIPEPDEKFDVILSNPKNGLLLGTPSRATVTILANDDAGGFIYLDSTDVVTMIEPRGDDSDGSTAKLVIRRGPGMYGLVNVPYVIIPELPGNRNDLTPMQGSITFQDKQTTATLTLTVLDDEVPEDAERFTLRLQEPDGKAKLGTKTDRTIIINSNDSPNGLFSLYAAGTRLREVSVEEGVGRIQFDIVRTQGLEGTVTVDVTTEPGTAQTTADVSQVVLVPIQDLTTSNVGGWYSFNMNGSLYMLMYKPSVVGEMTSDLGSRGSTGVVDMKTLLYTTLFRWQGELMPVQTVETDGISSAEAFVIGDVQYLAITNKGNHNRYQTMSRVYRVDPGGTLTLLQNLDSKGATDVAYFNRNSIHYLVIANSLDNTGTSVIDSDIWRWEPGTERFSRVSTLRTLGASAVTVMEIEGKIFLAVANNYDSAAKTYQVDSKIYKFDTNEQFSQHQSVPTLGAIDVAHTKIRALDLLVFANNRDNTVSSPQKSDVYRWDTASQKFQLHEKLETNRVQDVELFKAYDDTVYAVFANTIGESAMFGWDVQSNRFQAVWTGPPALSLVPIVVAQQAGEINLIAVADKNITTNAMVHQLVKVKDSDYAPRTLTMTMSADQDLLHASVVVLQDTLPEDTETFYVRLTQPTGGAEIGINNKIAVNILSNDNAHGIIEIAPDSRDVQVQELAGRDNTAQVNVIRRQGFYGLVTVKWIATGDHDGTNDITPLEGIVEFPTGQSVATISLTVRDDDVAELLEVTYIQLTQVVKSGTSLTGKGALIGENKMAKVTVLANDSPYGVVKWEKSSHSVMEPEGSDSIIILYIVREQGLTGELQVTYKTSVSVGRPVKEQAVSGEDYISRQGMVLIQENVTRVPVEIVIRQDSIPEPAEVFLVNITRVALMGMTPPAGSEPSVRVPGNIVMVTIGENDNARGIVQFNVTTNIEGRIDTYEEFGMNTTIPLLVTRSVGFFGPVTVTWQAEPREATILDFSPSSGTLSLADTQGSNTIYVNIIDDNIAEEMETFDIKLISVSGGALLGPVSSVRIAILKNDSPNGLFRFVTTKVVVRESKIPSDPDGEARLIIERIQGSEGVVKVQWRINAEAVYDFYEPHTDTLVFGQGVKTQTLMLRTKPDSILEGEEKFRVSLITADNNADISHTQGDATVVVLPDPGASGTVEIMPDYRTVYIGEPGESDPSYSGKVQVVLTRGAGIFGDISVTWSITPRDESAFLQVEGTVQIVDLQQKAAITIQALDDTVPELRSIYTLQLNSATGGALLSEVSAARLASVVFVASDYPHGEFVFDLPQKYITTEDRFSVSFPVIRRSGLNSQVFVTYKTHPGTATPHEDYFPEEGTLTFQHGQKQLFIDVQLKQDDKPEGVESFFLNLTSARLVEPGNNNYSEVNGLKLDQKPTIGSLHVKEIMIERNDNAEGTIQFQPEAVNFIVTEEDGMARIPLVRNGGHFGKVSVRYRVTNGTATEGVDYVVPSGELVLDDGQGNGTIDVTIRDDSTMEDKETFTVQLVSTTGGALLGSVTLATVTIAKSDYPNGKFGFVGALTIVIDNPSKTIQRMFSIERTGGLLGEQEVSWRILGPNNPLSPLQETNDIAYISGGRELTAGTLTWQDGQAGEKTFSLDIKPFSSWEIEKAFIIQIHTIQGTPASSGHGEVSPTRGSVKFTISKFGHPNGIVRFNGPAQTVRYVEEPEGSGSLTLQFPILRRQDTGTVGNIQILWEVQGISETNPDVQPRNGSSLIGDEKRVGEITLQILPDGIPELNETFKLVITKILGGAEIDTQYSESTFIIRYNDQPHGVFGIVPANQSVIVDPVDLSRHVRLVFTRYSGTFGSVIVTFSLKYDIPQSGIALALNDGTVKFEAGQASHTAEIQIEGTGFLEKGTTFSVSLIEVQFLGSGVTEPPKFKAGETEAKVTVPAIAANSKVGFSETVVSINEGTSTSRLTLVREGMYGTLQVSWQSGYPGGRVLAGFTEGTTKPTSSSVTIPHGVDTKDFTIELAAKLNTAELFAVHLPVAPATTVPGGARLIQDQTLVNIEPHGVLRFADNSTAPAVSEMFGKIYLQVLRLYGSQGKVEVQYRAVGTSASEFDFRTVENNAVPMEPGQTSALIMIEVMQDNKPEQAEVFHVNLTDVEKFPTDTSPSISPRISSLHGSSVVTIQESNDPYGVLSLAPETVSVTESFQKVNITVERTGGIFGTVRTLVRTVGGGEDWTSQIVPKPGAIENNTIAEILGNRDKFTSAVGGTDYVVLDTVVEFKQGETAQVVSVTILSDEMAEPAETVLVYITQPTGGARIAKGEQDGGRKGFSVISIQQNDLSNGLIGFSQDFLAITVDEDKTPTFSLKLARTDAFFGEVEITWVAKVSETSTETEDLALTSQLVKTAGTALCPPRQANCFFNISLVNDNEPEEEHSFIVKLVSVKNDAKLNTDALVSRVTVAASDYIRGLIEVTQDSSMMIVGELATSVRVGVSRVMGLDYRVEVAYRTMQILNQRPQYGITVYPALEGADYVGQTGTLVFEAKRQDLQYIDVTLTPFLASSNPLPKQFYVELRSPTNGASINPDASKATMMIVTEKDLPIWKIVTDKGDKPLTDAGILDILTKLDTITGDVTTKDELTLLEDMMNDIADEGLKRKLPTQIIKQLLNLLCKLLVPDKADATRGRYQLADILEKVAYMMLTGADCPSPAPPQMNSLECVHAKVAAGRWPIGNIQSYQYAAQRQDEFKVPEKVSNVPLNPNSECADFHMIEYSSEQWFQNGDDKQLLSSKIISFGLKGRPSSYSEFPATFRIHSPDRRIATRQAQCVYFDTALRTWVGPKEVCEVTNDLDLGVDDYVDCSCKHLTQYAVKATTSDPGLVGYSVWFYVSCFICMSGLAIAILAHHLCSISAMFSASLLMHMCFAAMATQICYVVAAYLSTDEILVYTLTEDNYRCIVMGLFLHYFFLAQFSWMMTQALNFWKILVLNDEHTDRKYVLFFLLGWGLPVVILAVFYVITFNLYRYVYHMPYDFIYGDVNNNGDICFVTNPYAGLGGVILPVLLMLVVVAVVFVKAFQVTPQWQAYDDIYRGRYNIREVRTLLLFWAVIITTWLWGGLHLVYGHLWMLIIFCIFNILQGVMAFVLYALLRNPCLAQCGRTPKASSYSMASHAAHVPHIHTMSSGGGGGGPGQYQFHPTTLDVASLKGSRASLLNESWERDSLPSRSTMKVKRTLPQGGNIYIDPPVYHQNTISDTKDFDDLLYALKTGGSFTPSDINSSDSDKSSEASSKIDKYELRRIDIADTHL